MAQRKPRQGHPQPIRGPAASQIGPKRLTNALLIATPFVALAGGIGAAGGYWYYIQEPERPAPAEGATRDFHVSLATSSSTNDRPSKIIYLNREGATLFAGVDDSSKNRSSIVKNSRKSAVDIPAFAGTPKAWDSMVQCVREKFSPYDVSIVDRRPPEGSYIMAVVGGKAHELGLGDSDEAGHDHSHEVTGLAPFNNKMIANAVVLVFSRSLKEDPRRTCETAAMEIAHAYGLDHTRSCKELMSYTKPCGPRVFTDANLPCGEHADRPCENGQRSQNSHARLVEALGGAGSARAAR